MVSALLHVMWRKTAMVVTVERWEGTLAGKPMSIVVTYFQFDSNIRVLYVFLGIFKNI